MLMAETSVHVCDRREVVGHQRDRNWSLAVLLKSSGLLMSGF